MTRLFKVCTTFMMVVLLATGCVQGQTPQKQSDDIKKLSNRQEVNHVKLEQTTESEWYATNIEAYLGTVYSLLPALETEVENGSQGAQRQLDTLLTEAETFESIPPVEPFHTLKDLHHSYLIALQELAAAKDVNDARLHSSYATLTIRLYAMEYQSIAAENGIKAKKDLDMSRID
ncbi:hypothetical protein [Shouchella lehensis]|uniref:Lipoprotein n=1 Tax=Shouchella lehensis G1 TaxID=1246626 RepID=A0A060LTH4_9BACI|nr:hypothetical protein [Shouchella lehensis]AIC94536.1 hypothetical protein BleG1_1958 [Shouchella lehensis G1]